MRDARSASPPTAPLWQRPDVADKLPCDVLISAHPEASQLWQRLEASATRGSDAFIEPQACRAYVAAAHTRLDARLEQEKR